MAHDTDPFNRWEAGQELAQQILVAMITGDAPDLSGLTAAFRETLANPALDRAFTALALGVPSEAYLADQLPEGTADPDVIHEKRDAVMSAIVDAARAELWAAYRACADAPAGEAEGAASGRRALRSFVLQLLCRGADADPAALECALEQFRGSTNMTDQMGALRAVVLSCPAAVPDIVNVRQQCLDAFYDQWKEYPLVVLKWLRLRYGGAYPHLVFCRTPQNGRCCCRPPLPAAVAAACSGLSLRAPFFWLFVYFFTDSPEGPPTATNRQPPTATNRHQPPTATNRQPPPTANRHQPPTATNRQPPPTANHCSIPFLWSCVLSMS